MKILIATFTFPPESNGVSYVTYAHAVGLAKRGHEVAVVTKVNKQRNEKEFRTDRIRIFEFNIEGSGNVRRGYSGEIREYQEFIAHFNADVMLFHCWQTWTTDLAIPMFPYNKAKKILISHGVSANLILSPKNFLNWLCWRPYIWKMPKMLKAFDHIVFLTSCVDKNRFYDFYLAQKLKLVNYSIIPNGTYPMKNKNIDFKQKFNIDSKYIILQVANYNFIKNQKLTLEAFAISELKNTILVFIGNEKNSYSNKLEKLAEKLNIKNKTIFLEKLPREMIVAAYLSSDLFVCSSLSEVQPLVILDAMRAGVPFISTNVGCIKTLAGGIIIKNKFEMAEAMRILIENEALRKRLGDEGKRVSEEMYDWEIIIDKYESLLRDMSL